MSMEAKKSFIIFGSNAESLINFRGNLIKLIEKYKFTVSILCPFNDFEEKRLIAEFKNSNIHNIPLERGNTGLFGNLKSIIHIFIALRCIKCNSGLFYTIKPVIFGGLIATILKRKNYTAMITGLGISEFLLESKGFKEKFYRKLFAFSLHGYKRIIFQNRDDHLFLIEKKVISPNKKVFFVNGSGVDINKFKFTEVDDNNPKFLFMARLLKSKGINEYFEASKNLKKKYHHAEFSIAGWLDEQNPESITESDLEKIINSNSVTFLGKVDPYDAITKSNIFVLPSYREGLPRSVLEAMSCGRPIITTNAPGCKDTVIENHNGILAIPGDIHTLELAMETLILDKALRIKMGFNSRKLVEENFADHKVNQDMIRILNIA